MKPTGQPERTNTPDDLAATVEDARALSPLGLTADQLRGGACVWCGAKLALAAVDLGIRPDPRCPWVSWFPRACTPCHGARV